jgi:hypothetical protein
MEDVNLSAMPKKQIVPGLKQGERIPKGRTVTYLANNIIRIENVQKLKPDEAYRVEGSVVDVSLIKSRTSGKKTGTRIVFDYNNGFCPWLSLLRFMQDNKLLYGAGVSLSFEPEKKFKFSQANFREQIKTNPEFLKAFMDAVTPHLKMIPPKRDTLANDNQFNELLSNPNLFMVA